MVDVASGMTDVIAKRGIVEPGSNPALVCLCSLMLCGKRMDPSHPALGSQSRFDSIDLCSKQVNGSSLNSNTWRRRRDFFNSFCAVSAMDSGWE